MQTFENWVLRRFDQLVRRFAPAHIRHAYFRTRARQLIVKMKARDVFS